ncbi:MAG: Thioredoxin reductase [candidate division WS2 bacterium ADurb.Bin280]|uniref:Thioredoxin reductase n=1 Tax=candidate division WS2 bacterium ADurb.Bin280 TaxID=1852829 RepID=A0A1V5SGC4_9BACT|nr:MAG: Thioredoxin reductase [candidate division WS2 bacterium ADurb.Bin280]
MIYDTIIIGGGPSGLTAAIYLGRYQRKVLLLTGDIGGQTSIAGTLENYPGISQINGFELANNMLNQVKSLENVEVKVAEPAKNISVSDMVTITTEKGDYEAKTALIAAGKRHRELGLDNEKSLIGKGVSYCATCDGPFAKGKDVVIIGGGYAATEAALILEKLAKSVAIVNIGKQLSGETLTLQKIESNPSIKVINESSTIEITEEQGSVSGIKYKRNDQEFQIEAKMIFVEIGQIPNSENFKDTVELNKENEIIIDENNQTSTEKIYAAGDITNISAKQTIVACGEGAKAAIQINKFLEKN